MPPDKVRYGLVGTDITLDDFIDQGAKPEDISDLLWTLNLPCLSPTMARTAVNLFGYAICTLQNREDTLLQAIMQDPIYSHGLMTILSDCISGRFIVDPKLEGEYSIGAATKYYLTS
jgi:hypothetical protein